MRQRSDAMTTPDGRKPIGVLHPVAAAAGNRVDRYLPSPPLAPFVDRYWIVRWELPATAPHTQETLPHPTVHLAVEAGRSGVYGVVTGRFTRLLEGRGRVVGVKFRPGGFRPFVDGPIARLTDTVQPLGTLFPADGDAFEQAMLGAPDDDDALVTLTESFLLARDPVADARMADAQRIAALVINDRTILRVDDLAARCAVSPRALQRLFNEYVGVSPKWVIRRARLHEAAERAASGVVVAWSGLALDLGYYDQAHFINDFRALVGVSPNDFVRRAGEAVGRVEPA